MESNDTKPSPTVRCPASPRSAGTAQACHAGDNPFGSLPDAAANSSYGRVIDGDLVVNGREAPRMAGEVHAALRAVLHDPDFPCLGAKSIMNQQSYRFGFYAKLGGSASTQGLAYDLYDFVQERASIEGEFVSYVAAFQEPKARTPKPFEDSLWTQLAALHLLDHEHFSWSEAVSSDPADPAFSFSFAGNPFFVVGLSPASKRWARRFPWPTLVFNDHFQFERLREEQRFTRIRDAIRERDEALHGEANQMLTDFGKHSEARQYSGRKVGPKWRCPVTFEEPNDAGG